MIHDEYQLIDPDAENTLLHTELLPLHDPHDITNDWSSYLISMSLIDFSMYTPSQLPSIVVLAINDQDAIMEQISIESIAETLTNPHSPSPAFFKCLRKLYNVPFRILTQQ